MFEKIKISSKFITVFSLVSLVSALFLFVDYFDTQDRLKDFELKDLNGSIHSLQNYKDSDAIILMSYAKGCPIVRLQIPTLKQIAKKFSEKKISILLIDAHLADNEFGIEDEIKKFGIDFPVLMDPTQEISRKLNYVRTADTILINPKNWKVIYRGAIDDRIDYGIQKDFAQQKYLESAVMAHFKEQKPKITKTEARGCIITYKDKKSAFETSQVETNL